MCLHSAWLVCAILGVSACVTMCVACLCRRGYRRKRVHTQDVEGGVPDIPDNLNVQESEQNRKMIPKQRKRKMPTPPSPSFCLVVPSNTPDVRRGKIRKRQFEPMNIYGLRKGGLRKKKMVRFQCNDERTRVTKTEELPPVSARRKMIADVKVIPLEISSYRKNFITQSLFAGNIHLGYPEEVEDDTDTHKEEGGDLREENVEFNSWRELFARKMNS